MKTNVVKIKNKEQEEFKRLILSIKAEIKETERKIEGLQNILILQESELYQLIDSSPLYDENDPDYA